LTDLLLNVGIAESHFELLLSCFLATSSNYFNELTENLVSAFTPKHFFGSADLSCDETAQVKKLILTKKMSASYADFVTLLTI
jgi:hypothetical protein